jgi:hypothetical protein
MASGWPVRNLRASVTWMEAARLTAVERMPAVSQVSTLPEGAWGRCRRGRRWEGLIGGYGDTGGRRAAKQTVWGRMFMVAA